MLLPCLTEPLEAQTEVVFGVSNVLRIWNYFAQVGNRLHLTRQVYKALQCRLAPSLDTTVSLGILFTPGSLLLVFILQLPKVSTDMKPADPIHCGYSITVLNSMHFELYSINILAQI